MVPGKWCACLLLWAWMLCRPALAAGPEGVIPVPWQVETKVGQFHLTETMWWYTDLEGEAYERLAEALEAFPTRMLPCSKAVRSQLQFCLLTDPAALPGPEAYRLRIGPRLVSVEALTDAGLFYGVQTLLALLEEGKRLPCVEVTDHPRLAYRGVMIDVSRHFFSIDFLKRQVDVLARYKMNRLHLHLTDAAGWRLQLNRYPELTDVAAWRTEPLWKTWWNGDRRYVRHTEGDGAYGGFYTQAEVRDLVDYARRRYVDIIPEVEMPSHSEEVLAVYPHLSCTGEPYRHADFCPGKEATFEFLEGVLDEVMDLFPSEYIHIGGDEAGKQAWRTCPDCRRRMEAEGLATVDELQGYLIGRVADYLHAHGRRLMGWDEILQGGFRPTGDAVMSWRGEEGGVRAVQAGGMAVMTPGEYAYWDKYQDAPPTQPEAMGGYLPLEKVYAYDPVPDSLSTEEQARILGVQGNVWAEYVPTEAQMEYMLYPRALALAEVAWSAPERKSWPDFRRRALQEVERLQGEGYRPFPLRQEAGHRAESLQPVQHLAVGKPVTYRAPWHPAYGAAGDAALTDGRRGDWSFAGGAWQGFISRQRLDVVVDLQQPTPVRRIAADFLQVAGVEIYFPASLHLSASTDGEHFDPLLDETYRVETALPYACRRMEWLGNREVRYLRLQATASPEHGGWVFTDEIVVE